VSATLQAITSFQLTTSDPRGLVRFYTGALGFESSAPAPIPAEEMRLLGVAGKGLRTPLRLGRHGIDLDAFDPAGRPYPAGATAADLCFQHLAIATSDAAAAWERARAHGAIPISQAGIVTLPRSSGGVTAIKFRDPEGHPLELIQFPPTASSCWPGEGTLGIDHSAINVGDIPIAETFFTARGLAVSGPTLNRGPTQVALDGLADAEVDVVPMLPPLECPHLELLRYRVPRGRESAPLAANDIAATRIVWRADVDALLCDPAGHLHLLRRT
jgi:catechol 2,3-dioxygenase-like lactoylglutathione lyase family enzyme